MGHYMPFPEDKTPFEKEELINIPIDVFSGTTPVEKNCQKICR